jgi:hypothetical protein
LAPLALQQVQQRQVQLVEQQRRVRKALRQVQQRAKQQQVEKQQRRAAGAS